MMHNFIAGVIGDSYGRMGTWDQFWHCLQVGTILLLRNWADSFGFNVGDFPSVSAPTLAPVDSLLLGIIEYNFIPLPQDLMTRKGGLKEVMRGINGGLKRLIKLLTMKYYYHCFINSPKIHIPHNETYSWFYPYISNVKCSEVSLSLGLHLCIIFFSYCFVNYSFLCCRL